MTNTKQEGEKMKNRDNHPQKASRHAAEDAPMEPMMDMAPSAEPSYADMLQEAINMLPPDGYPRPVVLPPPAVAAPAKRVLSRRTESMADYDMEPQFSLSEPERDKDYWIRVLRDTAVPKPR